MISHEEQAEGLWAASEIARLRAKHWLNEDEACRLWQLEVDAGLRVPPPPSERAFDPELWAHEIVDSYKAGLIMRAAAEDMGRWMADKVDRLMLKGSDDAGRQ